MEVKKIVEGMTAPEVAEVIDRNFKLVEQEFSDRIVQETGNSENVVMSQKAVTSICGDVNSAFQLKGKDMEAVYGVFNGLISGKKYRVHLFNPNVGLSDASGSAYRFVVSTWNGSKSVSSIIAYATHERLTDDYYFTMPNDGTNKVIVECRCVYGAVFGVSVCEYDNADDLGGRINELELKCSTINYFKDVTLTESGQTAYSNNTYITDYLKVDAGTEVLWKFGDSTMTATPKTILIVAYNESKERVDYWVANTKNGERRILLGEDVRYIRATFFNIGVEKKYIQYQYNDSLFTWEPKDTGSIYDDIKDSENKVSSFVTSLRTMVGDDMNLQSVLFHGLIAGKTYRLHLFNPNVELSDTSGSAYRLYVGTWNGTKIVTKILGYGTHELLDSEYYFTMPNDGTDTLTVEARCIKGAEFPVSVVELIGGGGESSGSSITDLNPESEFLPKMMAAKKRLYKYGVTNEPSSVVIAHLSDAHANWENVQRFVEFSDKYKDYIDLLVNTGDTAADAYTDGIAGYNSVIGVENIINIIGNHDTKGGSNWQQHIGLDSYNMFVKPWVNNWGVIQPEGASSNGYCYFYKDFASNKLRIVFVDIMAYNETENNWLANVLTEANSVGYHVLIAVHFAGSTNHGSKYPFEKIDCNYSTMYDLTETETGWETNKYNSYAYHMMETVNTFITNGGIFVGYMQGHYHLDLVAKVKEYPNQLMYAVGKTAAGETFDYVHKIGTRNQDEFQIVSVNTGLNIIKLFKVGANVDVYGRHKNSVTIDYIKGEIVAEGF